MPFEFDEVAWVFRRASGGVTMIGAFELFHHGSLSFGFRLKAPDGTVVAVSGPFPDKVSAVEVSVSSVSVPEWV